MLRLGWNTQRLISFSVNGLAEKFAPQGADNLLDAVNSSEEWSGSPRRAYDELANLLDCISSVQK